MVVSSLESLSSTYYVQQKDQEHENVGMITDERKDNKDPLLINETTNVLRLLDDFLSENNGTHIDTNTSTPDDTTRAGAVHTMDQNQSIESAIDEKLKQRSHKQDELTIIQNSSDLVAAKILDSVVVDDGIAKMESVVDTVPVESTITSTTANEMGNQQDTYHHDQEINVGIDEIIEIKSLDHPNVDPKNNIMLNNVTTTAIMQNPTAEKIVSEIVKTANRDVNMSDDLSETVFLRELNNHQGVVIGNDNEQNITTTKNNTEFDHTRKESKMMDDFTCNVFESSSFSQMEFKAFSTEMNNFIQSIQTMTFLTPKADRNDSDSNSSYISTGDKNQDSSTSFNQNVSDQEHSTIVNTQTAVDDDVVVTKTDFIEVSCEEDEKVLRTPKFGEKSVQGTTSSTCVITTSENNQRALDICKLKDTDDVQVDHPPVLRRILTPNTSIAVPSSPTNKGTNTNSSDTNILTALVRKMSLLRSPPTSPKECDIIETTIMSLTDNKVVEKEKTNKNETKINQDRIIEARSTSVSETNSAVASVIHCNDDHSTTGSGVTDTITLNPSKLSTTGFLYNSSLNIDEGVPLVDDNIATTLENGTIPKTEVQTDIQTDVPTDTQSEVASKIIVQPVTYEIVEQEPRSQEANVIAPHVPFAIAEEDMSAKDSSSDAASVSDKSITMIKSSSFTSRAGSILQLIGSRSSHRDRSSSNRSISKKPTSSHLSNSSHVSFVEETQRIASMLTATSSDKHHSHKSVNSTDSGMKSNEGIKVHKSRSASESTSGESTEVRIAFQPKCETASFVPFTTAKNEVEMVESKHTDLGNALLDPLPSSTTYQSIHSKTGAANFADGEEFTMAVVSNNSSFDTGRLIVSVPSNKSILSKFSMKSASSSGKHSKDKNNEECAPLSAEAPLRSSGSSIQEEETNGNCNQISCVSSAISNSSRYQVRSACDITAEVSNAKTPSVVEIGCEMIGNGQEVVIDDSDQLVQHDVLVASPSNRGFSAKQDSMINKNCVIDDQKTDGMTVASKKSTMDDILLTSTLSYKSASSKADVKSVVSKASAKNEPIALVRTLSNKSLLSRASAKSVRSTFSRRLAAVGTNLSNRSDHKVVLEEQRDDHSNNAVDIERNQDLTLPSDASVGSTTIEILGSSHSKATKRTSQLTGTGSVDYTLVSKDQSQHVVLTGNSLEDKEEGVIEPEALLYLSTSHSLISAMSTNTMGTSYTRISTKTPKVPDNQSGQSLNNSTHRSISGNNSKCSSATPRSLRLMEL